MLVIHIHSFGERWEIKEKDIMSLEFNKQWISVQDMKPSNNDLIYVFNIKYGGLKGVLAGYHLNRDYFYADGGGFPIEVTHWYPLPMPYYN